MVKRRSYKSLISGDVCEGSYILLKKFQLATAKRVAGDGQVMSGTPTLAMYFVLNLTTIISYLVLEDFYAIGDDQRPSSAHDAFSIGMAERVKELYSKKMEQLRSEIADEHQIEDRYVGEVAKLREYESGSSHTTRVKPPDIPDAHKSHSTPSLSSPESSSQKKRKMQIALGEIDPNFGSGSGQNPKRAKACPSNSPTKGTFQTVPLPPSNSTDIKSRPPDGTNPLTARSIHPSASARSERMKGPTLPSNRPRSAGNAAILRPMSSRSQLLPIECSLNIKPLAAFRGYRRRSDLYDVFVVIHSVGDSVIKRLRMPPKRDIRIVDPSTDKRVLLSVFVEPENFIPVVGTIALIRMVSTHEFEGGMLNIYPNHCEGRAWFLPNPVGVEGCDVETMRIWWTRMQAKETQGEAEP